MVERAGPAHHAGMDAPPLFPPATWWLVAAVFALAGAVKGVAGLGLPTLAMALLSLWWPPAAAASLMLLPALLTNLAQCVGPHARTLARRLAPMWLGMVAGTLACPWDGLGASGRGTSFALGVVLAGHGVVGLLGLMLPAPGRHAGAWGAAAGAAGGLLSASTGVFVVPMVAYLQAPRLERDALVQALGLSFMVATLALAWRLRTAGVDVGGRHAAPVLAVALASAFAGLAVGARLRGRLSPTAFRRALNAVFTVLGVLMAVRAL